MLKKYFRNILISIDQFFNAIFGGDPDETISSRVGKNYRGSFIHAYIDWLFQWQKKPLGHSIEAAENDEGKDAVVR